MKRAAMVRVSIVCVVFWAVGCGPAGPPQKRHVGWPADAAYPETDRLELVEEFFGSPVADPYRWLEELDADETRAFIEAQNELSFPFLEAIPARDTIEQRLTELWNYERYGLPSKEGGRYFYEFNSGLLNQDLVYVTDSIDAEPGC